MTADPEGVAAEVVLREQDLRIDAARTVVERLVVRRRIVTQVRQVEVTVRREELEVLSLPDRPSDPGAGDSGPDRRRPPLVITLSEEVPVVALQTRPYEKVTVWVDNVTELHELTETVGREQVELVTEPAASAP